MKESLLDKQESQFEESGDGILLHEEHKSLRMTFLIVSQALFFILGAGFYSFPMWLNFILPNHVHLTRQALTLLGSAPFIGLLGISGALILWFNSLKFDKTTEFLIMTTVGGVCTALAWILLYVLVQDTPEDHNSQNISLICFVLILLGNAVGVYFTVWLGKLFPLIKPKYTFVFSACCNLSFAGGSIASLSLKLIMTVEAWISFMTLLQVTAVVTSFMFVYLFSKQILIHSDHLPTTEVSTKKLITELLLWKRQFDKETLATKDCEVRSSQFYSMLFAFTTSCALATSFMANLGPLLSANSDTSDNFRAEVIVLIWASVGQTVARLIIPYVARQIDWYMSTSTEQVTKRDREIVQLRIRNRLTLSFTFVIGLIFFVFLLALRLSDRIPFIFASSVVSGAYGSMWVINNTFPLFFPGYNFSVLLSFFQFFGMAGMMVCIVVISALDLNNNSVFVLLLIVAIIAMLGTVAAAFDRWLTEPNVN